MIKSVKGNFFGTWDNLSEQKSVDSFKYKNFQYGECEMSVVQNIGW